jgi:pilus assembly protein CpaB
LVAYVHGAKAHALEGERLVDVLVVDSPIAKGTKAESIGGDVHTERVPVKVRAEGAVSELDTLDGLVASVNLLAGEQLVRGRFAAPEVAQRGDLPPGLLEVTISLNPPRALGGQIAAGQTIGFIGSASGDQAETHLVLHKLLVTSVQRTPGHIDEATDPNGQKVFNDGTILVTLAVDAPSAERVVWFAEHGTIWLTNEPKDANEGGTKVQTFGTAIS